MGDEQLCHYCGDPLDAGRQFAYEFESIKFVDDEETLEAMRSSPDYYGEPLRLCKVCHDSIAKNQQDLDEEVLRAERDRRFFQILWGTLAMIAAVGACVYWVWSYFQ
ncbi:hypothetical protein NA78x_005106 [Anatilimnocola sp. NA78]|uniref:hypothetical protein n=1 Tax=Anatilimnocola sp. NA78 TaxID=3415683 RepID=UPI003CE51CA0